jgi:hypothetical protein
LIPREIDALGIRVHSNKLKNDVSTLEEFSIDEELLSEFESELAPESGFVVCPLFFWEISSPTTGSPLAVHAPSKVSIKSESEKNANGKILLNSF